MSQAYLEELHANHEDWLLHGDSASAISRAAGASVLTPRPEADAAADSFLRSYTPGREMDKWKLEVIRDVPAAIKDQVRCWGRWEGVHGGGGWAGGGGEAGWRPGVGGPPRQAQPAPPCVS